MATQIRDSISLGAQSFSDELTGRKVERLTPAGVHATVPYFTKEMFTADDQGVLVTVRGSDDKWRPHLLYPQEERMQCVCPTPAWSPHGPALGGNRVVYIDAQQRVGFCPQESGEFTPVFQVDERVEAHETCASACGRYAVSVYAEKFTPSVRRVADGFMPAAGSERERFAPRCVVMWFDLDGGRCKAIAGAHESLAHAMISPADPLFVEYCSAVAWQQGHRMYGAQWFPDSNYIHQTKVFSQTVGLDAVGHELFLQDGRIAAVWMHNHAIGSTFTPPDESFIIIVEPKTNTHQAYRTPPLLWNHLHGRDGKVFVSEGCRALLDGKRA